MWVGHSSGGFDPSCNCQFCLTLGRIVSTCLESGHSQSFVTESLARLRSVQSELLDAAELDKRGLNRAPGAPPPGPGPLGAASPKEGDLPPSSAEDPGRHSRKSEVEGSSHKRRRREKKAKESSPEKKSRSRGRRRHTRKQQRSSSAPTPKSSRARKREPSEKAEDKSERTHKEKEESSPRENRKKVSSVKQEPSGEELGRGSVAEVDGSEEDPAPIPTPRSKTRPDRAEESEDTREEEEAEIPEPRTPEGPPSGTRAAEEEADERGELVRRRAPRSPSRPPRREWTGPIRAHRTSSPPRWGKNRGLKKFQRNHDFRQFGFGYHVNGPEGRSSSRR